jgi:hypothetical protein
VRFQERCQPLLLLFKLLDTFVGTTKWLFSMWLEVFYVRTYIAIEANVPAPAPTAMVAPVTSKDGGNSTAAAPASPKPKREPFTC